MANQERLHTARATLIRALELTEKLLDGFPIPGAKGTIAAVLEIIKEAEVRVLRYNPTVIILIAAAENDRQRGTLQ